MGRSHRSRVRLRAVAVAALTAACAAILAPVQPASAATYVPINGAGSTWSYNAIHDWQAGVAQDGMTVNYQNVGSTSGRTDFKQGTVDFAASEVPYGVQNGASFDPPPVRGYAYMPDTAGGLAFVYNLHIAGRLVTNLRLSGAVVAAIFTNQITMWNDPMIVADNPGLALPATAIVPVVRTDSAGSTWEFTQWMNATQNSTWDAYCATTGLGPCAATTTYPMQSGTAMVGQSGDLGVSGYVSQQQADGAIGYTEYSYAELTNYPVAKVLNSAGYYTTPTAQNVGLSLLQAQVNTNPSDPLYLTENLSQVYADTDPRAYELSYYSYLIVPTDATDGFTSSKGYTLGAFGSYLLCQGQTQVDALGYAALPVNLVEAGLAQLQRIPGNAVPASTADFIQACANPSFTADGTDLLTSETPLPAACDQQGPTQCAPVPVTTSTELETEPEQPVVGQNVTLDAGVAAADGSHPLGSVQFEAGSAAIGSPVAVDAGGRASTTTTFTVAGVVLLTAVFTPADPSAFAASTRTSSVLVLPVPVGVTVSLTVLPEGTFTVTVSSPTIVLTQQSPGSDATYSAPSIPPATVTVTDFRNTYPGWSVSGQVSDFAGTGSAAGHAISGDQLGWTPTGSAADDGVLGPPVPPAGPGIGTVPALLAEASAGSGFGGSDLGFDLDLQIPSATRAGPYSATLTITAVPAQV